MLLWLHGMMLCVSRYLLFRTWRMTNPADCMTIQELTAVCPFNVLCWSMKIEQLDQWNRVLSHGLSLSKTYRDGVSHSTIPILSFIHLTSLRRRPFRHVSCYCHKLGHGYANKHVNKYAHGSCDFKTCATQQQSVEWYMGLLRHLGVPHVYFSLMGLTVVMLMMILQTILGLACSNVHCACKLFTVCVATKWWGIYNTSWKHQWLNQCPHTSNQQKSQCIWWL